ncbi:hypothetical protein ACQR1I_18340 [Bradyrhizobium sp. HKCCYLS2038]|uniref:hypothetical protein n=1 Tax=unclassified Bradyrhizobium TaxID=2631580 RepID=UPI003EBA568D
MDKKTAALLGAAAAAITAGGAQANTLPGANASVIPQASSYAELLAPLPNALALLQADDAARAQTKTNEARADEVKLAETVIIRRGRRHYHDHHHHHHHRTVIGIPGVGGVSIGRGHHHHHHHHHGYYDR